MTSRSQIKRLAVVDVYSIIKRIELLERTLSIARKELSRPKKPNAELLSIIDELLEVRL